ncbi:MAG: TatD family hydrolase, partial [Acidimicrobiales bacterium]
LTPAPHRGRPNEPVNAAVVGAAVAAAKGLPVEEVARATSSNASVVFDLH